MRCNHYQTVIRLLAMLLCAGLAEAASAAAGGSSLAKPPKNHRYEWRATHSPHGIGKFYQDREIAQVMGHQGASWLERPERIDEEKPDLMIELLRLKPGEFAADIGAGTGYHTRRLAKKVGPNGKVFAVDIQPEMLQRLTNQLQAAQITNVHPVRGSITNVRLPEAALDLVLMVDVYHEFEFPFEMIQSICRALKPGGRIALVEFRAEDPQVPIKALHKMTEAQVKKEMVFHPVEWVETIKDLPWQHLILFRKVGHAR